VLEPKVGRVVRETVPFLPESGQPGPRMEDMVNDQLGGRIRRGSAEGEGCAKVVARLRRVAAVVVYLIVDAVSRAQVDD